MFTREEASRTRQEFWTVFGKYMKPVPSSEGNEISWINYHTHVKDIHFRMDAGLRSTSVSIVIETQDAALRAQYFQQFQMLKTLLHSALGEEWTWQEHLKADHKTISRIFKELPGVSVMNKDQWHELISFFKPRIIALDAFWENARYIFEGIA